MQSTNALMQHQPWAYIASASPGNVQTDLQYSYTGRFVIGPEACECDISQWKVPITYTAPCITGTEVQEYLPSFR